MKLGKEGRAQLAKLIERGLLKSRDYDDFARLYRSAIALNRCFIIDCNGCDREKSRAESWQEYDKAREEQLERNEKKKEKLRAKIKDLCEKLKISYYIQSDPRGMPLYLGVDGCEEYHNGVAVG
jgi:hypothetical protein